MQTALPDNIDPQVAAALLEDAVAGGDETAIRRAQQMVKTARWYEEARRFGELVTREQNALGEPVIVATGGGPGIMEAANRGAREAGGTSIGCNIELPFEQGLNEYVDLGMEFRYFFVRKTMFVKYAEAFVVFPGGFGTMDELFEALTLIQTGKALSFPVVLCGSSYWAGLVRWIQAHLLEEGMIARADMDLLRMSDSPEEIVDLALGAPLR